MMMKKILILILMAQMLPDTLLAQNDDMYFVPKEKKEIKKVRTLPAVVTRDTYYCGSDRDVDEYNRRPSRINSSLVKVGVDSLGNDVFQFVSGNDSLTGDSLSRRGEGRSIEPGGYEAEEDYRCTRRMQRFDGYGGGGMDYDDYCYAYNRGYVDGLTSWNVSFGWYDPWWYSSRYYGWSGWYNSFYFGWHGPWFGGWYDPWYPGWHNHWYPGGYYPSVRYYSGITGTSNHSRGAYGSSRRHGTYNGHSRNKSYRDRNGFNSNRNRGFGNSRSNNRSWNTNRNNNRHEFNRSGFGGGNRSNGGFGGGHRSGGGSRSNGGGRFGGGR